MNGGGSRGDINDVTMAIDDDDNRNGGERTDKHNGERINEHMS